MIATAQFGVSSSPPARPSARRSTILAALVVPALLAGLSTPARAETPEPDAAAAPRRAFGFGTALGGGVVAAPKSIYSDRLATSPALMLPTLELQGFLSGDYSIDVTVPISNIILVSTATDVTMFSADAFFNLNAGQGSTRFIVGPGIGFGVASGRNATVGSLRIPAELGLEFLTDSRAFGVKLLARPTVEFAFAGGKTVTGLGMLGLAAFSVYTTTAREKPAAESSGSFYLKPARNEWSTSRSRPARAAFPQEVAGFAFGISAEDAQQACTDAGQSWEQEEEDTFVCGAPVKPAAFVSPVRLQVCDDKTVCMVELIARPPSHRASARFTEMRDELKDQYGSPTSHTSQIPRECYTDLAPCVLDGTAVVRAQWKRPRGGTISLEMDKPDESLVIRERYERAAARKDADDSE